MSKIALMAKCGAGVLALAASALAAAHGPRIGIHGGYWGPRVGIVIGAPVWGPAYWYPSPYYPPYYYPPAVVAVPVEPPQYIEQQSYAPPGAEEGYWYFCPNTKTYYPYVKTCAQAWQQVAPQAAAQ